MPLLSSILSRDICTPDGDNLEKDSFTFGQTQDSHVTRQLGVIRAAATILGCIVDATEHSHGRGSPQESTSQTTGPLYSADQIEQHIEASQCFSDNQTEQKFFVLDQGFNVHCRCTTCWCLLLYLHTVCCICHAIHKTMLI